MIKQKHIHPRSWWLENDPSLLGPSNFSGANSLLNFGSTSPPRTVRIPVTMRIMNHVYPFLVENPFFEPPGFIRINPSASTAGPSKVARTDGLTKVGFSCSEVSGENFFALFFGMRKNGGETTLKSKIMGNSKKFQNS